jgi:hypothetical protein
MNRMIPLVVALALPACATPPSRIEAAAIPATAYAGRSCGQLAADAATVAAELAEAEKKQRDAVAGDTFGVLMIGLPMSSIVGADNETAVAVAKGRTNAIASARRAGGCA